jgi:formate dehydrogenase major subunit
MSPIQLKINGREITARPGATILEVVREQQLDEIPTLCHSPELEPYASCFLCVVEVKGRWNLVPACATRVAPNMEVTTRNERILASRKTALELLLSNHYADCASPCQLGCPAGVDAQGYIALAGMGLTRAAVDLIRETNPLPAVCGRVCVRKCEVVCRRGDIDAAVGINAIKRYLTDAPGVYDGDPPREAAKGKSVGIVGAGPAGLTAAYFLGRRGYDVVVYEAMQCGGGMLRYGIPTYRLPDDVLDREIDYIRRAGAEIRYGVRVGSDVTLEELRRKHAALFLGIGAWTSRPMGVEGEAGTPGLVMGIDFLREKADDPRPIQGTIVVVGGGNTAMDCARTSWRLGADKVIILYRRTKAEMPADRLEIEDCLHEGIEIMELAAPIGVVKDGGRLKALRCIRMKLGEPDASGRRRPVPMEGSEFELPCAMAIAAIGQAPLLRGLEKLEGTEVGTTRWGTFKVEPETMRTGIAGIFAGGDGADDGPTVAIDAIADGQFAARAIHAYLSGEPAPQKPFRVAKEFWAKPGKAELGEIPESPRHEIHLRPVEERAGSFIEVATGFEPEDTAHESARCLACGCLRYFDCDLRLYAEEYGVDMEHFVGYVRKHKVDERHPYLVYDPNKCILCARCIRTCARVLPISALGLVGRGFRTEMRPAMNDALVETSCVACGNCIDACPTGALTPKFAFPGRAALQSQATASHCAFCSLGCAITVNHLGEDRYFVGSSGLPGEYLCRYGRFGAELFVKAPRLIAPAMRPGTALVEATLEDACRRAAAGLRAVAEKHGPESVAVWVSPELTNEELYLAGKIAREGLGTNNVGSLGAVLVGEVSGALDRAFGFTASTADRSVIADADLIICNNTSTEADHLILSIEMIGAVRRGAKLIVANSILDESDRKLAAVALDPMRGRSAILWTGVLRELIETGAAPRRRIEGMPGAAAMLGTLEKDLSDIADLTGVDEARICEAAALIAQAKRVVVVHTPDRPEDQALGDLETLANLVLVLRATGARADLLLPRLGANGAGLELAGADPAFHPGRVCSDGLPGAHDRAQLRQLVTAGQLRAMLVIGEDPLGHGRTGSYFQNLEFLAAIDWRQTETTRAADVALPGTTYLECEGTRCNFEGRRLRFERAVAPPSGVPGWKVLAQLATALGVKVDAASVDDLTQELERAVEQGLGARAAFYWNGAAHPAWDGIGTLVAPEVRARPAVIPPPLTPGALYKRAIREVGTQRFRVH